MTRFTRSLMAFLILATIMLGALPGGHNAAAAPANSNAAVARQQVEPNPDDDDPQAATDAATMQAWIDGATAQASAAGPDEGTLEQPGGDSISAHLAKIDLPDFYTTATFSNPENAEVWDYGIGFRFDGDNARYQINLQSDGRVVFRSFGTDDNATGLFSADQYKARPGADNRIDLVASGDTGYLAINGVFLATLNLSVEMTGGEIFAGSGFDPDFNREGTVVAYTAFEVWSLEGVAANGGNFPDVNSGKGGTGDADAAAEKIVRDWYEALYGSDESVDMADYLSDDFAMKGTPPAEDLDRDAFVTQMTAELAAIKTAFPDLTCTIADIIVSGDTVVARVIYKGTQTGELGNIPATGKSIEVMEISIYRVDLDKHTIYQAWTLSDGLGLLTQLGVTITAPSN